MLKIFLVAFFLASFKVCCAEEAVAEDFQGILRAIKSGRDAALVKSRIYEATEPIFFQKDGQKIYTKGAGRISEYAVLRIANPECGQIINSNSKSGILIENVVLDGNRYKLPPFEGKGQEMVWLGGNSANQTIKNCVLINARTWSSIKVNEGANGARVENLIIFGSGVDARGNGRRDGETPFKWGDGIGCGAKNTKIANNIIVDATDGGIVLFSAPGTLVKNNAIAAVSRELLGGINLVDGLYCYEVDKIDAMLEGPDATRKYDYSVSVENNLIDAAGARIHVAVPMGACIWNPKTKPYKLFLGAKITDNELAGDASAYGFVMSGVDGFEVAGNKSGGKNSGYADGLRSVLCDEPGAFIYDPQSVSNSKIQKDFKPVERSIEHLLRCNHGPTSAGGFFKGYRAYSYGEAEREAVVKMAFLEMLGRAPSDLELKKYSDLINEKQMPADELRCLLAQTEDFTGKNGKVGREDLHMFRTSKWLRIFDDIIGTNPDWDAKSVYKDALKRLKSK